MITKLRKNTKPKNLLPKEKYYLKHRGLIETVFDILKHIQDIEHARNRSQANYFVNVLSAIIAYTFYENKPSISAYQEKMNMQDFKNLCLMEV